MTEVGTRYGGGHLAGTGRRGASEFPRSWGPDEIIEIIEDVARNPDETPVLLPHGRYYTVGRRRGVLVATLIDPSGSVREAFPVDGLGVVHNPDRAPDPDRPTLVDLGAGRAGIAAGALVAELAGRLPEYQVRICRQLHDAGEWNELARVLAAAVPAAALTVELRAHLAVLI